LDESRPIWRYLDLAKFITLLTRGLHFTLPTRFGDAWEGAWGTEAILEFRKEYFGRPDVTEHPRPATAEHLKTGHGT